MSDDDRAESTPEESPAEESPAESARTDSDGAPSVENPFADADGADDIDPADSAPGPAPNPDPDADDRADAPFGDLARTVAERRERREAATDPEPFESVEVGDVDEDDLWASLATDDAGAPDPDPTAAEAVSSPADDRPEHVVDKREYCQRCPFLSAPPVVACEHEGTDIAEVVDADHFRVRGCPMATADGSPDFTAAVAADEPTGDDA
ncbi:hypothetical protein [Halobaculum marinum]|uniref:DUF8135 domain-containing protein n=1 Tax=Halobaculum marinum TaxID=3031996 RepID=A0ABD5WU25_9EURY|nr:hypothetical protein [Halobaculum sp. DT55]